MAKVKVLVIALMMPGLLNAFAHPSMPQTIGSPGRAIWKLLRIINPKGVRTRKPTVTSKIAMGSDGICHRAIGKMFGFAKVTVWPIAGDFSSIT